MRDNQAGTEIADTFNLLSQLSDVIIAVDQQELVIYWNSAAEKLYEIKAENAIGQPLQACYQYQWLNPEDEQSAYDSLEKNGCWRGENIHIKDNGKRIYVESTVSVLKDKNGVDTGYVAVIRDITQSKQQEEIFKKNAERFELSLFAGDSATWDWNLQTNEVVWSNNLYSLFGIEPDVFDGKYETFLSFVHPEDRDFVHQSVMETIYQQAAYDIEFRVISGDGQVRWSGCKGKVFYDDTNQPIRMIGVNMDITERKETQRLLQHQEAQYRRIVETACEGVWVIDKEGKTNFVNQQIAKMLGYEVEEILDRSFLEFMEETAKESACQLLERRKQGIREQHDFQFRRRDGSQLWGIVSTTPILDEQGQFNGALAMITDITSRKQAEEALRESEATLRSLFDSASMMVGITELVENDIRLITCNLGTARFFGSTPEAMKYTLASKMGLPEQYIRDWRDRYLESQRIQAPVHFEYTHPTPQGNRLLSITVCPIAEHMGKNPRFAFVIEDITAQKAALMERKQAEQKIREQAALIDISTDAIFVRDLNNRILFWSQGAERLYGWTAAESIGKNATELICGNNQSLITKAFNTTLTKGAWYGELEQQTKNAQRIIVSSRWTLVRDESGAPQSILVVNTNITEKKQLETQIYRAQRLESVGTLASGIAHDLNNVFTPIVMISQLLPSKFKNVDARTQEMFHTLENMSKRGANLVQQILTFTRGLEGKRTLLQPEHLLKAVIQVIKQTFPKSIDIVAEIPTDSLWMLKADPTQLDQVFMNLAVNARDAMPNGGVLKISAENIFIDQTYAQMHLDVHPGHYVLIKIVDTGTGIPPEILERIFEPFFTTKEVGQGTGLGLFTVLGIIKNHHGFVQVQSQIGQGTEFRVYLPVAEGTITEETVIEELPQGNGELILIVDDEIVIQQTTKVVLEEYNYKTLIAQDGIEAITIYAKHQKEISVVLMDLIMPNLDGLITMRTLLTMNPEVKIIATSGLPTNHQQILAAGAQEFLIKPYKTCDLLRMVGKLCGVVH
jgi:PAS domain S-box-containing protein